MALEYHLLTCLGTGTTVTLTIASPCVVTLTDHGMRNGHPVVFSDNGNTLPTGLTKGTTYYVRSTAANTFNLYATEAQAKDTGSTTGRINTSGSQSGTHILVGDYWYRLPVTDPGGGGNYKDRYYYRSSYRCYRGRGSWRASELATAAYDRNIIVEIYDGWDDIFNSECNITNVGSVLIHSKIMGQRSPAYHNGIVGAGYVAQSSSRCFRLSQPAVYIDGIEISNTGASAGVYIDQPRCGVEKCILVNKGAQGISNSGIWNGNSTEYIRNNIIIGWQYGIQNRTSTAPDCHIAGNLIAKCLVGLYQESGINHSWFVGNICIGNTTNATTVTPGGRFFAEYNLGETGNPTWDTTSTAGVIATTDFVDYANNDFRPTVTSPAVNFVPQSVRGYIDRDIRDAVRPNYQPATYPSENYDAGPYEYDHGNGLAPQQVTLSISGMADGSVLAVYKTSDGTAIISPTTIGASGSHSTTYSYTGNVQIEAVVRKGSSGTKYLPYSAPGLITSTGFSLIVNQVADGVLNG